MLWCRVVIIGSAEGDGRLEPFETPALSGVGVPVRLYTHVLLTLGATLALASLVQASRGGPDAQGYTWRDDYPVEIYNGNAKYG